MIAAGPLAGGSKPIQVEEYSVQTEFVCGVYFIEIEGRRRGKKEREKRRWGEGERQRPTCLF